jgi:transposase InsO family protein
MSDRQMVIIDSILHLSIKDLIQFGFNQNQLDKNCLEFRQGKSVNYSNIKGLDPDQKTSKEVTLISYDSIPEQTRTDKKMPSKEELLKQLQQKDLFRLGIDQDAYNFFLKCPDIKDTKEATRDHIAKGKAEQVHILKSIASLKPRDVAARGFANKEDFHVFCVKGLNELAAQRKWYKWKCNTPAELQKRLTLLNKVLKGTLTIAQACDKGFVSKKANNVNAEKLDLDQKAVLVQLMASPTPKLNFEQVWQFYTRKAKDMIKLGHWPEHTLISESAVRAFLSKPSIIQLWYESRHGHQEYRNVFEPVTQRERPSYANALWVIDGTPSHRYFQHGEKGRYFRFNLFPVLDAHSYCVIGFWLSEKENTEAVLGALRSACFVSNCLPHQVLYDNSSAIQSYRAQEAIDKISVVHFAATAGNARSKIVENFFHLFNQDVQKFRPGFTANPFAIRLDNQPNREALAQLVKSQELPLAENALKQVIEDLTIWNNKPRKFLGGLSPLQAYKQSVEATQSKQRQFSDAIDIEAFWTLPGDQKKIRSFVEGKPAMVNTFVPQQYEFTNRGIDININGNDFTYDIEDPNFRRIYIGQKFIVRYEPNRKNWIPGQNGKPQPDRLLLYLQGAPLQWNGVHASAMPKEFMPMAVADYKPGTRGTLDQRIANKKTQRQFNQQDLSELVEHTKKNGTYIDTITENAYEKEVLINAAEQILNGIIMGADNILDAPTENAIKKSSDTMPAAKPLDRLAGYDEPLPLAD